MKQDIVEKRFWSDPGRIADLINGSMFEGKQVIKEEDVEEVDSQLVYAPEKEEQTKGIRCHDLIRKVVFGANFFLLGIENQSEVDPFMPLRALEYLVLQYTKAARILKEEHKKKKDLKGDEFLAGYTRKDRLSPVVILVLYYGVKPWDGAKSLSELLNWSGIPEEIRPWFLECRMNLIEINQFEGSHRFCTDLRLVFGFLQRKNDREELEKFVEENREGFSDLRASAYDLIKEASGMKSLKKICKEADSAKEDVIDMCKAIDDMMKEKYDLGMEKGIEQGIEQGVRLGQRKLACLVQKLLMEGKSDNIMRALQDEAYRNELFCYYKLP